VFVPALKFSFQLLIITCFSFSVVVHYSTPTLFNPISAAFPVHQMRSPARYFVNDRKMFCFYIRTTYDFSS